MNTTQDVEHAEGTRLDEITECRCGFRNEHPHGTRPRPSRKRVRKCLQHELSKRGLRVRTQVCLPVAYDGILVEGGYKIDLLVEEKVVVELKVVEKILEIYEAQLLCGFH